MKKIRMKGYNKILNYLTFKERLEYTIGEPKSIAKYLVIFDPEVSTYYLIDGISGDVLRTTSSLNELIDFMHSQSPGLVALHNIKSNEVSDYKPDFVYFFVDEGKFVNLDHSSLNIEGTTVIDSSRVLQNIASIGQTLTPSADSTYDLGNSDYRWKNLYLNNSIIFPIEKSGTENQVLANGIIQWRGLGDRHKIFVEEYSGTGEKTRLVIYSEDNPNQDYLEIRQRSYLSGEKVIAQFKWSNTFFNNNVLPLSDNTYDLGSSTLRWRNLYAVNVIAGDIIFQNSWKITEYDESGQLMNGLRILNKNGEEIFKITEDGLYFNGKKIA